jgi:uncharacterized damage-inducible protein DinB
MSVAAAAMRNRAASEASGADQTRALTGLLEQLRDLVTRLPTAIYLARPAARVSGSVGEHVRHCLDHVAALTTALDSEELSYDVRRRGTSVEVDPVTAANEIERLCCRLDEFPENVQRSITLSAMLEPDAPVSTMRTTVARELAFVIQHTIHHCALIAVLLEWQGWRVPYGFGLAPATAAARALAR